MGHTGNYRKAINMRGNSLIQEGLFLAVEVDRLTQLMKSVTYRKFRIDNWIKDGMCEFHEKDLKVGQYGTATQYQNGRKFKIRTFKRADGYFAVFKIN